MYFPKKNDPALQVNLIREAEPFSWDQLQAKNSGTIFRMGMG